MRHSSARGKGARGGASPEVAPNRLFGLAPRVWVAFEQFPAAPRLSGTKHVFKFAIHLENPGLRVSMLGGPPAGEFDDLQRVPAPGSIPSDGGVRPNWLEAVGDDP